MIDEWVKIYIPVRLENNAIIFLNGLLLTIDFDYRISKDDFHMNMGDGFKFHDSDRMSIFLEGARFDLKRNSDMWELSNSEIQGVSLKHGSKAKTKKSAFLDMMEEL